jgi:hypothetical protein
MECSKIPDQTKTPSELNRDDVIATVWLPVARAQYFLTLQPILHVWRARPAVVSD